MMCFHTLNQLLEYNPDTGVLTWKTRPRELFASQRAFVQWNQRYANTQAGTFKIDSGYIIVSIYKKRYRAHRIAWCFCTKKWPSNEIDHINGVRSDNRIANLRQVSRMQNTLNKRLLRSNKTGYHGISCAAHGKYRAKGNVGYKQIHLGYFDNLEDAVMARKQFEAQHGFHENHGVSA